MTRRDSLRALYEAVREGTATRTEVENLSCDIWQDERSIDAGSAYSNDMNAALALHEAVLPGWGWSAGSCSVSDDAMVFPDFNCPIHGDRLRAELPILVNGREWPEVTDIDQRPPGDPARALFLADLAAMIEQEGEG